MKRRTLSPERLLVVSILAGIGCTTSSSKPEPPVVKAASTSPSAALESTQATPIELLRDDLAKLGLTEARGQERFRPLCDAEGYTIVGNVMLKTVGGPVLQPSELCADLRSRSPSGERHEG